MVVKWILLLLLWPQCISELMHHIKPYNYQTSAVCLIIIEYLVLFGSPGCYLIELIFLYCSSLSLKVLNEYFHNVCELDLVFNFYKVRTSQDYFCL